MGCSRYSVHINEDCWSFWGKCSTLSVKISFIHLFHQARLHCFQRGRHPEPITVLQESACQSTRQAVTVFQKLHRKHGPTLILKEATSSCTKGSLTREEENPKNTWSTSESRLRQDGGSWLVLLIYPRHSFYTLLWWNYHRAIAELLQCLCLLPAKKTRKCVISTCYVTLSC